MGVLYAKVAGQWVPVAPAGTVAPPAYAGPEAGGVDAIFTNLNARTTNYGFNAEPGGATKIHVPPSKQFNVWNRDPGNTVFYPTLQVVYDKVYAGRFWFGVFAPAAGYAGMWRDGVTTLGDYTLLSSGNETLINVPLNGRVNARINNVEKMVVADVQTQFNGRVYSYYSAGTGTQWDTANFIADCSGSNNGRLTIYNSSISAYQLRIWPGLDGMGLLNWNCGAHMMWQASAFSVASSVKTKKMIRPLRVVPETVMPDLDPLSDTVEQPDIMALRPVVFRPLVESTRPVPDGNGGYVGEPFEEPQRTEVTRERLGLIAEEVQHVIPSAVSCHTEGATKSIDYAQVTVALLDHVQRLTDEVTALRQRITELEGAS